jgi:hypothetical protein
VRQIHDDLGGDRREQRTLHLLAEGRDEIERVDGARGDR